jgi:SAM-dependent methyltransferase
LPDDSPKVKAHWDGVYATREPRAVSWFEASPEVSLALIEQAHVAHDASILDIGGGASRLAGALVADGHQDVTVADISGASLQKAKAQLGADAERVHWLAADVRSHDFDRHCDLWHDRAVFHFMVSSADRDGYLDTLLRTLRPGGHAIIATFGLDGPTRCSGLPTRRYDALELIRLLGSTFRSITSRLHEHTTPDGTRQQFVYLLARRASRS